MRTLLLWLLAALMSPDLDRLGHDDWRVREAETARLDNPLAALLLPAGHDDPEVAYRLRALRTGNLKWLDARYVECRLFRADPVAWVGLYLAPGRSGIDADWDVFAAIHADPASARAVFQAWPVAPGENESFLFGAIYPHEYERWLTHRAYHRGVAPEPRQNSK